MSVLTFPVANKGVTMSEVPDKIAVFFEIANCKQKCRGCHSPELWKNVKPMSLDDMYIYAETQVDEGANAIVLLGGSTNDIPFEDYKALIDSLANVAPVCVYSGSDSESVNDRLFQDTDLTWIKTGSYIKVLGGLNSPKTNQRFYKKDINIFMECHTGEVNTSYEKVDMTHHFNGVKYEKTY